MHTTCIALVKIPKDTLHSLLFLHSTVTAALGQTDRQTAIQTASLTTPNTPPQSH